jgi:hypothetical protein
MILIKHLDWRKENNVDNILNEDFSYWMQQFPVYSDGKDFQGKPGIHSIISLKVKARKVQLNA